MSDTSGFDQSISYITFSGIPSNTKLSLGTPNEKGEWIISGKDIALLDSLCLISNDTIADHFNLSFTITLRHGDTLETTAPQNIVVETKPADNTVNDKTQIAISSVLYPQYSASHWPLPHAKTSLSSKESGSKRPLDLDNNPSSDNNDNTGAVSYLSDSTLNTGHG